MALNNSGIMSIGGSTVGASINLELNLLPGANSNLGQANFRTLAGVASGQIDMSDFYGKSFVIPYPPINVNTTQLSLTPANFPGYIAGQGRVSVSIAASTYLYSTSINSAALTISGFVAGDIVIIENYGYVAGKGGNGQSTVITTGPYQNIAPQNGGPAVAFTGSGYTVNLFNYSYIGGGGGGGGSTYASGAGGGAGGGDGGNAGGPVPGGPAGGYAVGGAGGGAGQVGSNGQSVPPPGANGPSAASGGGGGRIFPGTGGAGGVFTGSLQGGFGGGAGGGGACIRYPFNYIVSGTAGGSNNNAGVVGTECAGGGGGWGAIGGYDAYQPYPGSGGSAIVRNGITCNVSNYGSIYGAIV